MRLLMVSYDFPPALGGIQTYAYELAQRLATPCDDFAVVAPEAAGAPSVDADLPFEVFRVNASFDSFPLRILPLLASTRRRFDATFHTQWHTAGASVLTRRLGDAPRVFAAAHGRELLFQPFNGHAVLNKGFDRFRTWTLRHADAVFPVSTYTASLVRNMGVPPERIEVVHNGTDPTLFRPHDARPLRDALGLNGHKVLMTIGRLVPRKGIDTVLHALPQVAHDVPDVQYLIGGHGPDRPRLEALTQDLGLEERVRFLGNIAPEALPRYYNASDVFVMPSRAEGPSVEGFGIVFLEAGACGKPVVGARSGGIPDAVRDGETGLLIAGAPAARR